MLAEKRFWRAGLSGGLIMALLYFLLVYVRSDAPARFWQALGALLTTWRGIEVLATFCILGTLALAGAERLRRTTGWQPWQAGSAAGACAGLLYGTWLLLGSGVTDWSAAVAGMIWFVLPFAVGGGLTAAWYAQASE